MKNSGANRMQKTRNSAEQFISLTFISNFNMQMTHKNCDSVVVIWNPSSVFYCMWMNKMIVGKDRFG